MTGKNGIIFAAFRACMRIKRCHKIWLFSIGLSLLAFILYCNLRIDHFAKPRLYDRVTEVPHRHTALVLGTSPIGKNGGPNRFFTTRIRACAELYHSGKIDRILVSGDNRKVDYNEPEEMRQALIEQGIPEEIIFLDYAGFRTYDSVIRAKEVFGQASLLFVSQKFHNERAVFIAKKKGIDAIGYNAEDVRFHYGFITYVREWFARCKVFLDLLFGKKPHFLGEPVDIG